MTARPALSTVTYPAGSWGVGTLVFRGDVPIHHDEPSPAIEHDAPASTAAQQRIARRLVDYFAGLPVGFADLDLGPSLAFAGTTAFEAACVRAIQLVPYGTVCSYADVAARAGRAGAHRAAGSVCARGTLSILVPYHRVIRADGSLGSFGPGAGDLKRRLLALEGVRL